MNVLDRDSYIYREHGLIIEAITAKNPDFDLEKFSDRWDEGFRNYDSKRHEIFRRSHAIPIVKDRKGRNVLSRPANEAENEAVNRDPEFQKLITALSDLLSRNLRATNDDANLLKYAWEYAVEIGPHHFYGDRMDLSTLFGQYILPELRKRGHRLPPIEEIDKTPVFHKDDPAVAERLAAVRRAMESVLE